MGRLGRVEWAGSAARADDVGRESTTPKVSAATTNATALILIRGAGPRSDQRIVIGWGWTVGPEHIGPCYKRRPDAGTGLVRR